MATMTSGLGGPAGYGENVFSTAPKAAGGNDDGSVRVDVTSVFEDGIDVFGTTHTDLYINSNGLIAFGAPHADDNTGGGLDSVNLPAIVPFRSDIDIAAGGEIYRDLGPLANPITITWLDVAPHDGTGANDFQVVLTDTGGGDFDVRIIYGDIRWTSGGGGDPVATFTITVAEGYPEGYGGGGTAGDDFIQGGDGADRIDGGDGSDTIHGGAGGMDSDKLDFYASTPSTARSPSPIPARGRAPSPTASTPHTSSRSSGCR